MKQIDPHHNNLFRILAKINQQYLKSFKKSIFNIFVVYEKI